MWIRVPRTIFLIVGAIVGFFITAPLVAKYATIWWWVSAPVIGLYSAGLWRWGLAFLSSAEDVAKASLLEKTGGLLILLGYTFVGLCLLVYLANLAVEHWFAVAVTVVLLAVVLPAMAWWGMSDNRKNKRTPADRARIQAEAESRANRALGLDATTKPDDVAS